MSRDPILLNINHTLRDVSTIFLNHQIDGAPVVNNKNKLVGLITKSHIYRAVSTSADVNTKVVEVMKREPSFGSPDDSIDMYIHTKIGRLPVVDKAKSVIGMFTRSDIAAALFESYNDLSYEIETIINSAHNLFISVDIKGKISVVNKAAEEFLGIKANSLRGRYITEVLPNSGLMETLETGSKKLVQKIVIKNRLFISNRSPIKKGGKIIGAVAVLQDVSELESISRELENVKELNKELDVLIESSHDGLFLTDGKGITLRVNEAFEKLTGVKSSELVGRYTEDLVSERGVVSESVSALVLREKTPVTIIQKTKTGRLALTTGTPVFDKKGKIFRVVSNVRDITELNSLQNKLEEAQGLAKHYEAELKSLRNRYSDSGKMIVSSQKMKDLMEIVFRIAETDSTVLIAGESGTGKELIAETIHVNSLRKNGPFIKINCSAIPKELLESELFGYDPGAFTGAKKKGKAGYFEMARDGTLLLDEISEMPYSLQSKLLRVLENREIIRVGGENTIEIDVRIIAATNRDISKMVANNQFRDDLYYRLNVIPFEIPPLRERKEEIPILATHFLEIYNKKYHLNKRFTSVTIDKLINYSWPGNVRELKNLVERMSVISPNNMLSLEDLPLNMRKIKNGEETDTEIIVTGIIPLREAIERVEKQILEKAFTYHTTTREIAKHLKIDPSTVTRKAAKYGISMKKNVVEEQRFK